MRNLRVSSCLLGQDLFHDARAIFTSPIRQTGAGWQQVPTQLPGDLETPCPKTSPIRWPGSAGALRWRARERRSRRSATPADDLCAPNGIGTLARANNTNGSVMPGMRACGIAMPCPTAVDPICSRRHRARKTSFSSTWSRRAASKAIASHTCLASVAVSPSTTFSLERRPPIVFTSPRSCSALHSRR